jgi:hypothetical protein
MVREVERRRKRTMERRCDQGFDGDRWGSRWWSRGHRRGRLCRSKVAVEDGKRRGEEEEYLERDCRS